MLVGMRPRSLLTPIKCRAPAAATVVLAVALLLVPVAAGRSAGGAWAASCGGALNCIGVAKRIPSAEVSVFPVFGGRERTSRLAPVAPSFFPLSAVAAFSPCAFAFAWTATCKKLDRSGAGESVGECVGRPRVDELTGKAWMCSSDGLWHSIGGIPAPPGPDRPANLREHTQKMAVLVDDPWKL
jgi:hypothetical protein